MQQILSTFTRAWLISFIFLEEIFCLAAFVCLKIFSAK